MTSEECIIYRRRAGWSPAQLARNAGLCERTVELFEAGRTAPRPVTLVALRRAFRTAGALDGAA